MKILNAKREVIFEIDADQLMTGDLDEQDLREAIMPGVDFGGMLITNAVLAGANLAGANFYWCALIDVDLSRANLENANLQGCSIVNCDFRSAKLTHANFSPSNLGGPVAIDMCDFTGADLAGASFDSAIYDEKTKFPAGFYPDQHGMIRKRDWDPEVHAQRLKDKARVSS